MSEFRDELIALIKERGYEYREEPFQLASGEWSHDYIDGKRAVRDGYGLRLAARTIIRLAHDRGIGFNAVGGLTMGADPLAHAIAFKGDTEWFVVRKEAKGHGKQQRIEGTTLTSDHRVLLVDDVVTTGQSILKALDAVEEAGASAVLAVTLLDRGELAVQEFDRRGIPYEPVATFKDLGIEPVGGNVLASGG